MISLAIAISRQTKSNSQVNRNSYQDHDETSNGRGVEVDQAQQNHQTRHRVENVEPVATFLFVLNDVWKSSLRGFGYWLLLWRNLSLRHLSFVIWRLRNWAVICDCWNCTRWRGERQLRRHKCKVLWLLCLLLLIHLVECFGWRQQRHVLVHILRVSLLHPRLHCILLRQNIVGIARRATSIKGIHIITGNVHHIWLLLWLRFLTWSARSRWCGCRRCSRVPLSQFTGAHVCCVLCRTAGGWRGLSRALTIEFWMMSSGFRCEHEMNCVCLLAFVLSQNVF